jgi:hypothetical protein
MGQLDSTCRAPPRHRRLLVVVQARAVRPQPAVVRGHVELHRQNLHRVVGVHADVIPALRVVTHSRVSDWFIHGPYWLSSTTGATRSVLAAKERK